MRPDALAAAIAEDRAAGRDPFFVCATAGTTSTMAFDPVPAIAEICRAEGVWLHVDAAMSGIARALPGASAGSTRDSSAADSYCTNPHKWMGVNFDCDLLWVADRAALHRRALDPPRVPAHRGERDRRGDRLPRLADPPRTPVPGAEAVVRAALRRARGDPSHDPQPRHLGPGARRLGRRGRPLRDRRPPPAQLGVRGPSGWERGHRRPRRGGQRQWRRALHPLGGGRALHPALLRRRSFDRAPPRRGGLAVASVAAPADPGRAALRSSITASPLHGSASRPTSS